MEYFEDDKWIAKKLLPQFSRKFEFISTYTSRAWRIVSGVTPVLLYKVPYNIVEGQTISFTIKKVFLGQLLSTERTQRTSRKLIDLFIEEKLPKGRFAKTSRTKT